MRSACGGDLLHRFFTVFYGRTVQYARLLSLAPSYSFSSMASEDTGANWKLPIKVSLTESAGRGVFASRRIVSAEFIYTAKPLVTHASLSLSDRVCYYCLRKLKSDASFSSMTIESRYLYCFCSEACRNKSKGFLHIESKADWSLYHEHCRVRSLKYPLMVKRFACMVISGAAYGDSLDILQPASLPPEAFPEIEEEFDMLKFTLLNSHVDVKRLAFLTKQWYMGVLARIRINAFRIELVTGSHEDLLLAAMASVAAEATVGNAVYMLPSFHNHDCDPNTHILWIDNAVAKLKALRDIEEGEELCICYLDASMDRDARQDLLARGFGFECHCLRCRYGD